MVKKLILNIPDDSYEQLAFLSEFYKQDVNSIVVSILDAVSQQSRGILNLSKEYKMPVELNTVMFHLFDAGFTAIYSLFNEVLEKLEVKGLYVLEDFEAKLDEDYIFFAYSALVGCNLHIDSFYLTIDGLKTLTTNSLIDVKKVSRQALGKLKELVQNIVEPEEFVDLEDYNIEIEEEEEFWTLKIDCMAESLDYLPSVKQVSRFVERIFKKAGIR
jgi:hypothetical protein